MSGKERKGSGAERGGKQGHSTRGTNNSARTADPQASTSEQDPTQSVIQVRISPRVGVTTPPGEGMREDVEVAGEVVGPVLGAEVGGEQALFVIHEEEEEQEEEAHGEDVDIVAANEGKSMHMEKLEVLGGDAPNDEEKDNDETGQELRADENADEEDAEVEEVQDEQAEKVETLHEGDQERAGENPDEEDDQEGEFEDVAMDEEGGAAGENVYDEEDAEEEEIEDVAMDDGEEGAAGENVDEEDAEEERVEDVAIDEEEGGAVVAARANQQAGNQLVLAREIAAAFRGVGQAQEVAATDAAVVGRKQKIKRTKMPMTLNRPPTGRVSVLPGRFTGVQGIGYAQQQMPNPASSSQGGTQTVQNERQDAPEVPAKKQLTSHQMSSMRAASRAWSTNPARAVEPNAAELKVSKMQLKKPPKK